jgi:hypothetical protein
MNNPNAADILAWRRGAPGPGKTPSSDPSGELAGARHELGKHKGPLGPEKAVQRPSRATSFDLGQGESLQPEVSGQLRADTNGVWDFFEII